MPRRDSPNRRNLVEEGSLNTNEALLMHHKMSMQIFEASQKSAKAKYDTINSLMAGEVALKASGPIHSDSVYVPPEPKEIEITRHPDDHVIRSTCELVMVGNVQSCQHGILCKERK